MNPDSIEGVVQMMGFRVLLWHHVGTGSRLMHSGWCFMGIIVGVGVGVGVVVIHGYSFT